VRLISWVHTVELSDPWHWVNAGDLLMCTGLGLPVEPSQQVDWLKQLAQRKISALLLACPPSAPKLSPELLQEAQRLSLPLLTADFSLEFSRLSRLIIGSVLRAERMRFAALEGLFQLWAKALHEQSGLSEKLAQAADYLHLNLALEDSQSGQLIAVSSRGVQVPTQAEAIAIGAACLRLWPRDNPAQNKTGDKSLLLRSLVGLLAVELERQRLECDAKRLEGAALLRQLLQGHTELSLARPLLEQRGLFGDLLMLAISTANQAAMEDLHHRLALRGLPLLLLEQDDLLFALVREVDNLPTTLGENYTVGISSKLSPNNGFVESQRQARLALAQAKESGERLQRYGEASTGLLPHSLSEAQVLLQRWLAPLMDYDREHGSVLLKTLMQFLDNNSQYKATCLELGIHRQTLVYRLKLIKQLTGLNPSSSEGLARLWITVQAGRAAGLL